MAKLNALGKGLDALLPSSGGGYNSTDSSSEYFLCPVDKIIPNAYQPRKIMNDTALRELSESIKEKGVLQPLVVCADEAGGFELIAGERRWRAAQLAGLERVPVIVKDIATPDRLELAIIENIQRQDLNPLEEAEAFHRLMEEFQLTQELVAKRVGKDRSTVANALRILQLPDFAKEDLASGILTMGHARVLLGLSSAGDMKELRDVVIEKGLSVRQTEALAKKAKRKKGTVKRSIKNIADQLPESYCESMTKDLVRYLDTKIKIVQNGSRGKLEIEYYSADDLERLLQRIVKE